MHARYQTIAGRPELRFERHLAHPVESVWRAITDPQELEQWFPSSVRFESELSAGAEITFTFAEQKLEDQPMTMSGRVTELDPPRVFAFEWGGDQLRFELAPSAEGTTLHFTVRLDAEDKAARDAAGWHQCLDGLERILAGAGAGQVNAPDDWRARYAEYAERGLPTGAEVPDMQS